MKRIILTGGGTAGHVTPNIALLPALQAAGYEIAYVGSYEGIEKKLIADFNFFLQIYDFNFKLRLFVLVGIAHHGKAFIVQLALGVVLVNLYEQPLQFGNPLFVALQLLPGDFHFLRGFHPQVLLHDGDKVLLMPQNIAGDQLNVPQNQMVQNLLPDKVGTAFFFVLPMQRTLEESTFRLIIVGCAIVKPSLGHGHGLLPQAKSEPPAEQRRILQKRRTPPLSVPSPWEQHSLQLRHR